MKTKQSRRNFLKVGAAGTLGAVVLSSYAWETGEAAVVAAPAVDPKTFGIGLQLYTVRDAMEIEIQLLHWPRYPKFGYEIC